MKWLFTLFFTLTLAQNIFSKAIPGDFYEIKVYHLKSNEQVKMTEEYLKDAYLPALHRLKIKTIGVFKPIGNDTAISKSIYVLIPFSSVEAWTKKSGQLKADGVYTVAAKNFITADADNPPYERIESILLQAFTGQSHLVLPAGKNSERVFELRSYESPTENLHEKKMAMFNSDEIEIFSRLGFNPVFYAKVISGNRMPNLMYMPVFDNIQQRDAQWKRFGEDAQWKRVSSIPENENKVSVSHIDSILMHSTEYSDF
ncbi:MAG: NIPSNAP family protein [Bacteroidota bacterium]|nr:NIPSNAP family protein [Bacteroidota bacterium]